MNAVGEMIDRDQVNSFVLGAADNAAQALNITIAPPARDLLLRWAIPALEASNQEGELAGRRGEIEHNTTVLIDTIYEQEMKGIGTELTFAHMSSIRGWFCEKFPYFFPFCPPS